MARRKKTSVAIVRWRTIGTVRLGDDVRHVRHGQLDTARMDYLKDLPDAYYEVIRYERGDTDAEAAGSGAGE